MKNNSTFNSRKFFIFLVFFTFTLNSFSQDIYDKSNNQLKIPRVTAYGRTYTNVVVEVDKVLRINDTSINSKFDSFNGSTGILEIPAVKVGDITYRQVAITIGKVLQVENFFNDDWKLTNIQQAGEIDFRAYAPAISPTSGKQMTSGWFFVLATGDLNNDGYDDIVIGPNVFDPNTTVGSQANNVKLDLPWVKLIVLFFNPLTKQYEINVELQSRMPIMQYAHNGIIKDFNGDGYTDFLAVGTGPDQGQPCGEPPVLMLGSAQGLYDASNLLPRYSGYAHQFAVGDFNNDGVTDFYIINNPWVPTDSSDSRILLCEYRKFPGTNSSFILLSNKNKSWDIKETTFDSLASLFSKNPQVGFNGAKASDIDGDGNIDLILTGGNWSSFVDKVLFLKGDGKGNFNFNSSFSINDYSGGFFAPDIGVINIDNEKNKSLVISMTNSSKSPWFGSEFKVLKFNGSNWSDTTSSHFLESKIIDNDSHCINVNFVDINNDGSLDLICTHWNTFQTNEKGKYHPRVWIRTSDGYFTPTYHQNIDLIGKLENNFTVNHKGTIKLVGMSNQGFFNSSVKVWLAD